LSLRLCVICKRVFEDECKIECCGMSVRYFHDYSKPYPIDENRTDLTKKEKRIIRQRRLSWEKEQRRIEREQQPKKPKHRIKDSVRELVLKRDKHRCTKCKSRADLHIHHVVHRSKGGTDDLNNLVTLCDICHADEHKGEKIYKRMRRGIV